MSSNISKRLDRLEAKIRRRQPTALNTIAAIEEANRRWHTLRCRKVSDGGLSQADQAEYDRLLTLLEPAWAGANRITELVVREAVGPPLTPAEAAELAELKRRYPPDPLLDAQKANAIALKKSLGEAWES